MKYILKFYKESKYYGCKRRIYLEFNSIGEVLKYIVDNQIKDFTIYQKYDNVIYEEDKND